MTDQSVNIMRGGVRLISPPQNIDIVVDDWNDAVSALMRSYPHDATLPISIDSEQERTQHFLNPRSGSLSDSDGTAASAAIISQVPWVVHAPMVSPTPYIAVDAADARNAVQSVADSTDRPVQAILTNYAGDEIDSESFRPSGPSVFDDQATVSMPLPDYDGIREAERLAADDAEGHWPDSSDRQVYHDEFEDAWDESYDSRLDDHGPVDFRTEADIDEDEDENILRVSSVDAPADGLPERKNNKPRNIIIAAVVCVLLMGAAMGLPTVLGFGDEPEVGPTKSAVPSLERPPMSPWTKNFSWTMGVDPSGRVGATPDGKYVGLLSSNQALHVVSASTGDSIASIDVPGGPEVGPRGTTIGGKQALVAREGTTLYVWIEGSPTVLDINMSDDAGDGATVTFTGREPIVLSKDAVKAFRITDKGLAEVKGVEDNARPYAVTEDNKIVVGKAEPARLGLIGGKDVALALPGKKDKEWVPQRWLYVSDSYALILWGEKGASGDDGVLAMHSTKSGKILSKTKIDNLSEMSKSGVVTNEQGGTFALPGYTFVVDPEGQDVSLVKTPNFTPSSVVGDAVFGKDKSGRAVARVTEDDSGIERIDAAVLVPWVTTADGSGIAVSGGIAYCLEVESDASTPTPAAPGDVEDEE